MDAREPLDTPPRGGYSGRTVLIFRRPRVAPSDSEVRIEGLAQPRF